MHLRLQPVDSGQLFSLSLIWGGLSITSKKTVGFTGKMSGALVQPNRIEVLHVACCFLRACRLLLCL